jgi:hypothetical protein
VSRREKVRRTFFVDREFQFNLAWHYLLVTALFLGAGLVLVFAPSAYVLLTTDDLKSLEPAVTEFFVLHKRIWPAAFITLAGVFLYSLLIGHRIAGSMFRVNETLRQLLRDEFPESVRFRKSNYFHDTAKLLEGLSGMLAGRRTGEPAGRPERSGKG